MLYTRPSDGFIDVGGGGGIGCAFIDDMTKATLGEELIIDKKIYQRLGQVRWQF